MVILGAFTLRYVPKTYVWRMQEITDESKDPTGSIANRKENMLLGLEYVIRHPLSTYGIGNHSYMLADKKGDAYQVPQVFRGFHIIHNNFLQVGADIGLIPLLFYLLFILSLFNCLRKAQKMSKVESYIEREMVLFTKATRISLVTFLGAAFFLPVAYRPFLFYIGGLCIALYRLSRIYFREDKKQPLK
jgi:O-antigen ligase